MSRKFRLLRERPRLAARPFDVVAERWQAPDGREFERQIVRHPGAVAILPFVTKDRVLLVRQWRAAARQWLLEFPAGTLERGESPLRCARRELIEETGYAARRWRKLGSVFTAPGFCTEVIHLYEARDLRPAQAELDDDEYLEVVPVRLAELHELTRRGRIRDAKSLSMLLLLQQG